MFSHVQLTPEGTFLRKITAGELIEWDANNYCTAFALEKDGKADEFNVKPFYTTGAPDHDPITQSVREIDPAPVNGNWTQQWEVVDLDPEQIAYNEEQAKAANKAQAASLLTATDWTTIPDVSDPALSDPYLTNAAEFAAYRSAVRKIAVNPPVTVDVWPIKPEEVWSN